MFRMAGILLLIAGSNGFAFSVVGERKAYLERCRTWRELFTLIESEIAFQKSSLPEICCRAEAHLTGNKKQFLERLGSSLDEGADGTLGEIWQREVERIFEEEPLKQEAEDEVKALGRRLCFEDGEMQRKMLGDMERYLKKHEEEQENLNKERNKLTLCAGVMGGLFLTILFL